MKETLIGIVSFIIGVCVMGIVCSYEPEAGAVAGDRCVVIADDSAIELSAYDPNDPIYMYIPPAHESWTEQFGDSERTRLMHTISELRVVVAAQGRRLLEIESKFSEPNEVKE